MILIVTYDFNDTLLYEVTNLKKENTFKSGSLLFSKNWLLTLPQYSSCQNFLHMFFKYPRIYVNCPNDYILQKIWIHKLSQYYNRLTRLRQETNWKISENQAENFISHILMFLHLSICSYDMNLHKLLCKHDENVQMYWCTIPLFILQHLCYTINMLLVIFSDWLISRTNNKYLIIHLFHFYLLILSVVYNHFSFSCKFLARSFHFSFQIKAYNFWAIV